MKISNTSTTMLNGKNFIIRFCVIALVIIAHQACLQAQTKQEQSFPEVAIEGTELRPFHCNSTERDYLLYIAYPPSYQYNPERTYPVVYMTDAYWNFSMVQAIGSKLFNDHLAPEYILVGIGYDGTSVNFGKERMFELSPTPSDYGFAARRKTRMGGARQFLDGFKHEIIPHIEEDLRVDTSFRALVGSSMGGLFSLYSMYEEPGLFDGILAISPIVGWDHCWLIRRESELRNKAWGNDFKGMDSYSIPTRLYLSVGELENSFWIGPIKAMDAIISNSHYKDFEHQFHFIEGEGHSTVVAEAFTRGLRFVFKEKLAVSQIDQD